MPPPGAVAACGVDTQRIRPLARRELPDVSPRPQKQWDARRTLLGPREKASRTRLKNLDLPRSSSLASLTVCYHPYFETLSKRAGVGVVVV